MAATSTSALAPAFEAPNVALDAAIVAAWTDAEDAEYWHLKDLMYATPITAAGLAEWDRLALAQIAMQEAVNARAAEAAGLAFAA